MKAELVLALNEYSQVLLELRKTPRAKQLLGETDTPTEEASKSPIVDAEGLNQTPLWLSNDEASGGLQLDVTGIEGLNFPSLSPVDSNASGLVPQTHGNSPLNLDDIFRDSEELFEQWRQNPSSLDGLCFPSTTDVDMVHREKEIMKDLDEMGAMGGPSEDALAKDPSPPADKKNLVLKELVEYCGGDVEKAGKVLQGLISDYCGTALKWGSRNGMILVQYMRYLEVDNYPAAAEEEEVADDENELEDSYNEPDPELPDFKSMTKEEREDFCHDDVFLGHLLRYDTGHEYTEADLCSEQDVNKAIDLSSG
ncbi:MAG: hypothetical protein Q9208_005158 [Pyrenodesmia sp. 3 TL-2023]